VVKKLKRKNHITGKLKNNNMKYFIDTEFLEGTQKRGWFGRKTTKPTIDLISIGIVCEDGRKYYAICNEFNFDEAWNRYDQQDEKSPKVYWIRANVLINVWLDFVGGIHKSYLYPFTYENVKRIFKENGRSKAQIANDICAFIYGDDCGGSGMSAIEMATKYEPAKEEMKPEFYAYYSAYDWVAFCWIFGKMKDLPKGFPMYCNDLKQMLDQKADKTYTHTQSFDKKIQCIKDLPYFPKNKNEHHALSDAEFDFELYKFLQNI